MLSLVVTDGAQSVYKRTSGPPAKQYVQQIYSFSCCGVSGVSLALLSACQFLVCVNISLCILASAFVEVHIVSCFIQLRRWQWTWEKHTLNYYSTQKSGLRWAIFVLKQFFNTLFWLNFNGRLQSNAKCTLLCWTDFLFSPIEDFDTMTMWYFMNSGTTRKEMPAGIPYPEQQFVCQFWALAPSERWLVFLCITKQQPHSQVLYTENIFLPWNFWTSELHEHS